MKRRQKKRLLRKQGSIPFQSAVTPSFLQDLTAAPKQVQKKFHKDVRPKLELNPSNNDDKTTTKMVAYDDLWRYRLGEYRIIYTVDFRSKTLTHLALGHRKNIYGRLDENLGKDTTRLAINHEAAALIPSAGSDTEPKATKASNRTPAVQSNSEYVNDEKERAPKPIGLKDATLDKTRLQGCVEYLELNEAFSRRLVEIKTEGELLEICGQMPGNSGDTVLEFMFPKPISARLQEPPRLLPKYWKELEFSEETSLESLLLKLDSEQKVQVKQFEKTHPSGPWMIKGGPGSGKSTIAIHCIHALMEQNTKQQQIFDELPPVRILFTSYTKSLVNSAKSLISHLGQNESAVQVDAANLDRLVAQHLPAIWKNYSPIGLSSTAGKTIFNNALSHCKDTDKNFQFSEVDLGFIEEEIAWVILGDNIDTVEEYLKTDRAGRGRRLGVNQRRNIWALWSAIKDQMRIKKHSLFPQRIIAATDNSVGTYDFVFVDEAQDLSPAGIKFCLKLAKDPSRIFLTADTNQSIYGVGVAWSKISSALDFRGRSRVLKRNYRTCKEICTAIKPLISGMEGKDVETIEGEPVSSGIKPALIGYRDTQNEPAVINAWLFKALLDERASPKHAAILCRTNKSAEFIAKHLDPSLNAKMLKTSDDILGHNGVKVITAHSAKGLQFPIVAVTGLEEGKFPFRPRTAEDNLDHYAKDQRLLFVACSRAMRRLAVSFNQHKQSRYVDMLDTDDWELF